MKNDLEKEKKPNGLMHQGCGVYFIEPFDLSNKIHVCSLPDFVANHLHLL